MPRKELPVRASPQAEGSLPGHLRVWGGWGSNPRPADYEETGPVAIGAGLERSRAIGAGQLGAGRMRRDRPGRGGMGRMFPFCSHRKAGSRLAGLRVVGAGARGRDSSPRGGGYPVRGRSPGIGAVSAGCR
jgi:hypothetical protein